MSDPRTLRTRRTHNLLLIQKILTLRAEISPFTLVLDSVEQGAGGLVREFVKNAQVGEMSWTSWYCSLRRCEG